MEDSSENKTSPQEQEPKPQKVSKVESFAGQILSGSILTKTEVKRYYPYVLFMALLMFLYIANGYHIQKLHRRNERLSEQIKELRARSLTISTMRMTATRPSEIVKELQKRGIPLIEATEPPKIIDK